MILIHLIIGQIVPGWVQKWWISKIQLYIGYFAGECISKQTLVIWMNLSLLLYLPKIRWRVWFSPKFGGQLWGYLSNCHVNRETIIINDDSYLPDSARPMRGRNFQKNEMAIRNQWPIEKEQWLVEVVVHQRMWKWWFRCGWNDIIRTLTRETEWSDEPLTRMNERTTERTKEWAMNE